MRLPCKDALEEGSAVVTLKPVVCVLEGGGDDDEFPSAVAVLFPELDASAVDCTASSAVPRPPPAMAAEASVAVADVSVDVTAASVAASEARVVLADVAWRATAVAKVDVPDVRAVAADVIVAVADVVEAV